MVKCKVRGTKPGYLVSVAPIDKMKTAKKFKKISLKVIPGGVHWG